MICDLLLCFNRVTKWLSNKLSHRHRKYFTWTLGIVGSLIFFGYVNNYMEENPITGRRRFMFFNKREIAVQDFALETEVSFTQLLACTCCVNLNITF